MVKFCLLVGSCVQRLQTAWQWIRVKIIELNLFKTSTMRTDPFERTTLKIATWIYLILLCLSMIIIVLFTWLSFHIQSETVDNPPLATFEDLQKKYPESLRCPCSQIAIPHDSFISVSPQFHPVCTSLFISDEWIGGILDAGWPDDLYMVTNFFISGHRYFVTLAAFCGLAKTTVSNASFIFNQSSFITDQALPYVEFEARAQQTLNQFESNTMLDFKRNLALIHSQTTTMYTTGDTDVSWRASPYRDNPALTSFQSVPARFGNCSCALSEACKEQVVLYNYTDYIHFYPVGLLFNIPNMFVGCFSIQSLLQSSLECLFSQTCLDLVQDKMNILMHPQFPRVNKSILQMNSTRFSPNKSIEEIVNEMMIEKWGDKFEYKQYYEKCEPKLCSYFVRSRNNALVVFTTMIALFGGLSLALTIIVPLIVGWIRNRIRPRVETGDITGPSTLRERVHALWRLIKTKALELNIFESEASWDDHRRRRQEIISTRIYFLILMLAAIILIVYTIAAVQIQSITEEYPSQATFEDLVSNPQYSPTLDCPCQNISILYNSFMSISPHYHQLCSSDFVVQNSLWINLVHHGSAPVDYSYDDYRLFIVPHFRLLFYLCTLANNTLTDALSIFRSNILVSKRAQSRQAIETQIKAALDQFRSSTPKRFMSMLDFIRQMAQGNGLVSSIFSNWYVPPLELNNGYPPIEPRSYDASNCSCGTNSMCTSSAAIDGWNVPGFLVGCYPFESLLQSTLECLYDLTCIDRLKNMYRPSNITIRPLNSTLSSPNVTIQSLMDVLMVDQWEPSVNYDHYYATCATLLCTYISAERANLLYIITAIIGLCGGLSVVLEIIVPVLVKIVQYMIMCRRQRIRPVVTVITVHE